MKERDVSSIRYRSPRRNYALNEVKVLSNQKVFSVASVVAKPASLESPRAGPPPSSPDSVVHRGVE